MSDTRAGLEKSIDENWALAAKHAIRALAAESRLDRRKTPSAFAANGVGVSHHAIIRYMERAMSIDMSTVALAVVTDKLADSIRVFGDGTYPMDGTEGLRAVIEKNLVVTVLPPWRPKSKRDKHKKGVRV